MEKNKLKCNVYVLKKHKIPFGKTLNLNVYQAGEDRASLRSQGKAAAILYLIFFLTSKANYGSIDSVEGYG